MEAKLTTRCCSGRAVQFFTKGSAHLCCMVEIVNDGFSDEAIKKVVEDRLMPRTENLPLYSTHEFNDKVRSDGGLRLLHVEPILLCN